jgi:hypothetical protein
MLPKFKKHYLPDGSYEWVENNSVKSDWKINFIIVLTYIVVISVIVNFTLGGK